MGAPSVVFDDVWKKFRRGERHDSLRDLMTSAAGRLVGRRRGTELDTQEFWAVKAVSFEVQPGRALGIIGPNGAGKSTTLKLLTKIIRPTRGRFLVRGRVGALIEIAAGFHPDLTGRENVYLQGTIMGMKRAEIRSKMDEIVDFAGVEAFIDTPVKRYSSGMNARLGFAIAAHLDPEVLIIDEVLSVGDMAFQERCVRRMERFKEQGVALVFVSHNLQAVASLCDEALFLKGEVKAHGATADVLRQYLETSLRTEDDDAGAEVKILEAKLLDESGRTAVTVSPGAALTLRVRYAVNQPMPDLHLGFLCYRSTDMLVAYDGSFHDREIGFSRLRAGTEVQVDFPFRANLTRGQYHLAVHVTDNPTQRCLSILSPAAMLTVEEDRTWEGVADLAVGVKVSAQDARPA